MTRQDVQCRLCDEVEPCRSETIRVHDIERGGYEGEPVESIEVTTGQCDECLECHGADEHCDFQGDARDPDYFKGGL